MARLVKLSEGSSRNVYDLGETVLKKPKNKRGRIECENEAWLYEHIEADYRHFLCPVLGTEGSGIVMTKAIPLSEKQSLEDLKQQDDSLDAFITYLIQTYELDDFDLSCAFNWGWIDEQLVLLDYGHCYFEDAFTDEF